MTFTNRPVTLFVRRAFFLPIILTASALIVFAAFVASARRESASAIRRGTVQSQPTPELRGQILITFRPSGFDPPEITVPKGRYRLAVDNRSGLDAVELRLSTEAGELLQSKRVPIEELDWRVEIDFNPGNYRLIEAGHADWPCRINITSE